MDEIEIFAVMRQRYGDVLSNCDLDMLSLYDAGIVEGELFEIIETIKAFMEAMDHDTLDYDHLSTLLIKVEDSYESLLADMESDSMDAQRRFCQAEARRVREAQ